MKKLIVSFYLLAFTPFSFAIETTEGSMKCKILESSVINVEDGKVITYSGINEKVSKGDEFTFIYRYAKYNDQTMTFMFELPPKKILFFFDFISFDLDELSYFNQKSSLALFSDELNTRSSSFSQNYIRVLTEHGQEIRLKRYYKGDWQGTYSEFKGLMVESHFFTCMSESDKVSDVVNKLNEMAKTLGKIIN